MLGNVPHTKIVGDKSMGERHIGERGKDKLTHHHGRQAAGTVGKPAPPAAQAEYSNQQRKTEGQYDREVARLNYHPLGSSALVCISAISGGI